MTTAHLHAPVSPHDHMQGSASASVTLVEYGDYECPSCGEAYPIVKQLQERMGDRLRFVFRNFPLAQMHPHAEHAAEAAEAAAEENRFWEIHDTLYEHQHALSDADLTGYMRAHGLDAARFATDLREHRYAARVREDFASGVRSGVNGTPTFFINGARHDGAYNFDELLAAVEHAA